MNMLNVTGLALVLGLVSAFSPQDAVAKDVRIVIGAQGKGPLQDGIALFVDRLDEKSGGELKGKVFEGTLLNYAETPKGLSTGVAEVGVMVPAYARGEFPLTNFITDLAATTVEPVAVGGALTEFILNCEPCLGEFKRQNQIFMGISIVGPYRLMSTVAITDVEDLKGMKIRGFSAFNKLIDQWGATAVSLSATEVYEGFSSGQIEANIHLWDLIEAFSLGDYVDYMYDEPVGIYAGTCMFNTNLDFWKELSAENKQNYMDAAAEALAYTTVTYFANDATLADKASELKVEAAKTPDSVVQSIRMFQENNIRDVIDGAIKDGSVPNAQELGQQVLDTIEKWQELVAGIDASDPDAVATLYKAEIFDKIDLAVLE